MSLCHCVRYANIIPNGVQHVCMRDFTVNGVTIPANTLIQPQMTEILKVLGFLQLQIETVFSSNESRFKMCKCFSVCP